jgi:hypothetical protein
LKKFTWAGFAVVIGIASSAPTFATTINFNSGGESTDTVSWAQLGGDGTLLNQTFSAVSSNGETVNGGFNGTGGGLISVICDPNAPANCSWGPPSNGYNIGDTLIWAEDNNFAGTGPIAFNFAPQFGAGAFLQATALGQFTAQLSFYDSSHVLLGSETQTSDSNGDALYLGGLSNTQNVASAVFAVNSCGSFQCDPADFSINTLLINPTPEPSTMMLGGSLLALGFASRKLISGRNST